MTSKDYVQVARVLSLVKYKLDNDRYSDASGLFADVLHHMMQTFQQVDSRFDSERFKRAVVGCAEYTGLAK